MADTPLLIIGAGPFGLALSAHARKRGITHTLVGEPMEFWRKQMPAGMLLRSACDWHLDVDAVLTIDRYLAGHHLVCDDVLPVPLARYLAYVDWFQRASGVSALPLRVQRLDHDGACFRAVMTDGSEIRARNAVVAVGFGMFQHLPDDVVEKLPAQRFTHTSELANFSALRGKRCLVIGGRMAAFEWSALMREAGVTAVHISYRHDTPSFEVSEWSWIPGLLDEMTRDPEWYRNRTKAERDAISQHMWAEGRLHLEPWLAARIDCPGIELHPRTRLAACRTQDDGSLGVELDDGATFDVDHVVLATGYKADVARVPFVRSGTVWRALKTQDGYPLLDTGFQSSVPGLFFTSILAARDFGPFFGFTVSARFSARRIIDTLSPP